MKLKLTSKNTLAFGSKGVELELPTKGLTLIKGKHLSSQSKTTNAVGKSSLLDLVLWGLYGVIPKGRRKSDIINSEVNENSVTTIDIEINGGNAGAFRIMAWGGPQKNPR